LTKKYRIVKFKKTSLLQGGIKMGTWHIDNDCESALTKLNDALCSFERATGREYTLILVPESPDEKVHISQSGKPLPPDFDMSPEEILAMAIKRRQG
jgi:hypothetical protein